MHTNLPAFALFGSAFPYELSVNDSILLMAAFAKRFPTDSLLITRFMDLRYRKQVRLFVLHGLNFRGEIEPMPDCHVAVSVPEMKAFIEGWCAFSELRKLDLLENCEAL